MQVDWAKEDPKVVELCELVARAHTIYVNLPPSGQERADLLWDEKIDKQERKV